MKTVVLLALIGGVLSVTRDGPAAIAVNVADRNPTPPGYQSGLDVNGVPLTPLGTPGVPEQVIAQAAGTSSVRGVYSFDCNPGTRKTIAMFGSGATTANRLMTQEFDDTSITPTMVDPAMVGAFDPTTMAGLRVLHAYYVAGSPATVDVYITIPGPATVGPITVSTGDVVPSPQSAFYSIPLTMATGDVTVTLCEPGTGGMGMVCPALNVLFTSGPTTLTAGVYYTAAAVNDATTTITLSLYTLPTTAASTTACARRVWNLEAATMALDFHYGFYDPFALQTAVGSPLAGATNCPWYGHSGQDNVVMCNDGTTCNIVTDPAGFSCCNTHGKRAKCPRNAPNMCANPVGCASGSDHCCNNDCTLGDDGNQAGQRICEDCDFMTPSTAFDHLLCNDGTYCYWALDFGCCNNHGGRARCPYNYPIFCNAPNECAGGTAYCCTGLSDCPNDPDNNGLSTGPRTCDAYSSSSEKSLLLLLLLLLLLIPLLCSSCLLLFCCLRGKKKGADTPFATFDPQPTVMPPQTFASAPTVIGPPVYDGNFSPFAGPAAPAMVENAGPGMF